MLIKKLLKLNLISVRCYNICRFNDLFSINDLINFYNKHQSFFKLRNCGVNSNKELTEIYQKYNKENYLNVSIIPEFIILKLDLNIIQLKIVNNFIKNKIEKLTVRTRNAICMHLNNKIEFNEYVRVFFNVEYFQVENMKNIGASSFSEIKAHLLEVKQFGVKISKIKDDKELMSIKYGLIIMNNFSINLIPENIRYSRSIIEICSFLLSKNAFYKSKYNKIFISSLWIHQSNYPLHSDVVAKKYNYTKERIRQIRENFLNELDETFSILKLFDDKTFIDFDINEEDNILKITDEICMKINLFYNIDLSTNFIKYILSVYKSDQYSIIGNLEDVLTVSYIKAKSRHNWKSIYLIKKRVNEQINLIEMLNDLSLRINEKIAEKYTFNFKSYLFKFLVNDNINLIDLIYEDCEMIINQELDIYLDLDDNLVFYRNTLKLGFEYAYQALELLGKPSHLDEIYLKIKDEFPNYNTDKKKIRSYMRQSNGFVPIGRKSIYGLMKWENKLAGFKGGTIRDIVKEYLENKKTPAHISVITKFVKKYRPNTNERSIITNLKLDESSMFKFFINSHIGVYGKNYDKTYTLLKKVVIPKKTWEESYKVLTDFVGKNMKLPSLSNCSENEKILYRWFNLQKSKINRRELNETRIKLINKVLYKFPNRVNRNRSKGACNLDYLLKFIEINERLPKATILEEKKLYNFFYRKRKLHQNNELSAEEYEVVEKILNQHSLQLRSKSSLPNRYETLLNFVKENKRLPSVTYEDEQNLYHFFYKQRKLYESDELDDELIALFLSIAKEIQNIKYENPRN